MAKKSVMIGFKTTPEVREALEKIAESENRTLSNVINYILTDHLERNGERMPLQEAVSYFDQFTEEITVTNFIRQACKDGVYCKLLNTLGDELLIKLIEEHNARQSTKRPGLGPGRPRF